MTELSMYFILIYLFIYFWFFIIIVHEWKFDEQRQRLCCSFLETGSICSRTITSARGSIKKGSRGNVQRQSSCQVSDVENRRKFMKIGNAAVIRFVNRKSYVEVDRLATTLKTNWLQMGFLNETRGKWQRNSTQSMTRNQRLRSTTWHRLCRHLCTSRTLHINTSFVRLPLRRKSMKTTKTSTKTSTWFSRSVFPMAQPKSAIWQSYSTV